MGHRLMRHDGKCRDMHGHRYALEVTAAHIGGGTSREQGADHGMVVDFGHLKGLIRTHVVERLDHKFLVEDADEAIPQSLPGVVVVPWTPTGENLALHILGELRFAAANELPDVEIRSVRLFETPTSWADAS